MRAPCALLVLVALSGSACLPAEEKMVRTVERYRALQEPDRALDYLEGWLRRHGGSYQGWRYRVLLRLDQRQRDQAAREYARLEEALKRHAPEVLRDVVLGAGATWLLTDYSALATCGPEGVAGPDLFRQALADKAIYEGSAVKLEAAADKVRAVMRALPGRFATEVLDLLDQGMADGDAAVRGEAGRAVLRLWVAGHRTSDVRERVDRALRDPSPVARGAALRLLTSLPPEGRLGIAVPAEDDDPRLDALLGAFHRARAARGEPAALEAATRNAATRDGLSGVLALAALVGPPADAGPPSPGAPDAPRGTSSRRSPTLPIGVSPADALEARVRSGPADPPAWFAATWALHRTRPEAWPEARVAAAWKSLSVADKRDIAAWWFAFPTDDAGAALRMGTTDGDALVRTAVASGLGRWGASQERDAALERLAQDSNTGVRQAALASAAGTHDPALREVLARSIREGGDGEAIETLSSLALAGTWPFQDLASQTLGHPSADVREAAVQALLVACDPSATASLSKALRDDDPHVALRAATAVYLLVGGTAAPPPRS